MNDILRIEAVVRQLQAVARANDDTFAFRIEIGTDRKMLQFTFIAYDTTDGHTFVSGTGNTPEQAVDHCSAQIVDACASWGYTNVHIA